MKEGTVSYLFGCHQFIFHPFFVLVAWIKEYHKFPRLWELICIFLHDIGIIGLQVYTNPKQKENHWQLGAKIAQKLFGLKGFYMIAGHTLKSGYSKSKLFKADKLSWAICPFWFLRLNKLIEPQILDPKDFQQFAKINSNAVNPKDNHDFWIERRENE